MESKFKIEFTEQEINYVLSILQDQPFKTVAGLIDKIMKQANAQVAGPEVQEVPEEKEAE